jgi:hypothetical protein
MRKTLVIFINSIKNMELRYNLKILDITFYTLMIWMNRVENVISDCSKSTDLL